jgi:hypothetical protein
MPDWNALDASTKAILEEQMAYAFRYSMSLDPASRARYLHPVISLDRKTEKAIQQLRERGLIQFIQHGRSILVSRKALDVWLAGQTKLSAEMAIQRRHGLKEHPAVQRALQRVGTHAGNWQMTG